MLKKSLALWAVMLAVAVLFGALREAVAVPLLGDRAARALCTLVLCAVLYVLAASFVRRHGPWTAPRLLRIGALLAGLTLAFEFSMGLARGAPWEVMLEDYDVLGGRLWPLVPVTLLFGPLAAWRFRPGRARRRDQD